MIYREILQQLNRKILKQLDRQILKQLDKQILKQLDRQIDIYRYLNSEIDLWLEGRQ